MRMQRRLGRFLRSVLEVDRLLRQLADPNLHDIRRFTISVSADDLRVVAEHGYEGAASSDQDCRCQAVSRFISDTVACLDRTG